MGMRVGGAGSSAAMAAWKAQTQAMTADLAKTAAPAASAAPAAAANNAAEQQVSAAMAALATGSTFTRYA